MSCQKSAIFHAVVTSDVWHTAKLCEKCKNVLHLSVREKERGKVGQLRCQWLVDDVHSFGTRPYHQPTNRHFSVTVQSVQDTHLYGSWWSRHFFQTLSSVERKRRQKTDADTNISVFGREEWEAFPFYVCWRFVWCLLEKVEQQHKMISQERLIFENQWVTCKCIKLSSRLNIRTAKSIDGDKCIGEKRRGITKSNRGKGLACRRKKHFSFQFSDNYTTQTQKWKIINFNSRGTAVAWHWKKSLKNRRTVEAGANLSATFSGRYQKN